MNVLNFINQNSDHPLQASVDEFVSQGSAKRLSLLKGLTLRLTTLNNAEFIFRSQKKGIRTQIKLGIYKREASESDIALGFLDIRTAIAIVEELYLKAQLGLHPVTELRSAKYSIGTTFNAIYAEVLANKKAKGVCTLAFERNYINEIAPYLGQNSVHQIRCKDVQRVINTILESGRKSVAEKCLYLCKNLFDYASEQNICPNVTQKMTVGMNAGGYEVFKGIALESHDLKKTFHWMIKYRESFSETLYLYCIVLVCLGLRKQELLSCKWASFDKDNNILHIEREVAKKRVAIAVPISERLHPIFSRLKELSAESDFIFPTAHVLKVKPMCENTPNTALKRLFSVIEKENGFHLAFKIHDLRRTFRTMLSRLKIDSTVAELCINHRGKDMVENISNLERYDRYVKFEERKDAMNLIAERVISLTPDFSDVELTIAA